MIKKILFELCAESMESALIAEAGGADSVELCSHLALSGLTPDAGPMIATVCALSIPVHVMIRPRGGDFVYTKAEFQRIKEQVSAAKTAGAAGVAVGFLSRDGQIDVEKTRRIVALAEPMQVTFHRAFDEVADRERALEEIIACGVDRLLTSGGQPSVLEGAMEIAALERQSRGRISIMAGGGLKLENIVSVARSAGVSSFHGSLIRTASTAQRIKSQSSFSTVTTSRMPSQYCSQASPPPGRVLLEDVREAIRLLRASLDSEFDQKSVR